MAIEYKTTMAKSELLELATANEINVDDSMTKAAILDAIDAYNAQETTESEENHENTAADSDNEGKKGNGSTVAENAAESLTGREEENAENSGELFAYIGPTLPRGQLKENAIFRGTLPDIKKYLSDVLEEYPQAVRLIVPVDRLAEFSVKVKSPGNLAHKYYSDIVSAMRRTKEV